MKKKSSKWHSLVRFKEMLRKKFGAKRFSEFTEDDHTEYDRQSLQDIALKGGGISIFDEYVQKGKFDFSRFKSDRLTQQQNAEFAKLYSDTYYRRPECSVKIDKLNLILQHLAEPGAQLVHEIGSPLDTVKRYLCNLNYFRLSEKQLQLVRKISINKPKPYMSANAFKEKCLKIVINSTRERDNLNRWQHLENMHSHHPQLKENHGLCKI